MCYKLSQFRNDTTFFHWWSSSVIKVGCEGRDFFIMNFFFCIENILEPATVTLMAAGALDGFGPSFRNIWVFFVVSFKRCQFTGLGIQLCCIVLYWLLNICYWGIGNKSLYFYSNRQKEGENLDCLQRSLQQPNLQLLSKRKRYDLVQKRQCLSFSHTYLFIWKFENSGCRVSCQLGLPQKLSKWESACVLSNKTTRYIHMSLAENSVAHLHSWQC